MAYNMPIVSAQYVSLENIEAHTRTSSATGLAAMNRRVAAMGIKANANFIVSKGLINRESSRKLVVLPTPLPSFIAKPDYRRWQNNK